MRIKSSVVITIFLMHTLLSAEEFKCPIADCSRV